MYSVLLVILGTIGTSNERQTLRTITSYHYVHQTYNDRHYKLQLKNIGNSDNWLCLTFGLCSVILFPKLKAEELLTTLYQWGNLEYDYADEDARQHAIDTKEFIPENGAPIDMDVYYSGYNHNKVFVAIPRFQDGVPATFGTITTRSYKGNPVIAPFPSWSWHRNSEACARDRMISVFRFKIDECKRLWILDTGRIGGRQLCLPQILAFDLKTNNLIHRYEIPRDQIESTSILVTPVVDVRNPNQGCFDTFVYVADCQAFAIIVHDVQKGTSWRIVDKTFYPHPFYGTYNMLGYTFDLMDGILGMDLSPYKPGHDRILYYHALSSNSEQWVYTSHLRNHTMFVDTTSPAPEIFHMYRTQRHTQCPAMAIDKNGIAYFGLVDDYAINCWNTATEYGPSNIKEISQDKIRFQFASGVKVVTNKRDQQELWFVTMRFQRVATGTLDLSDKNFRIIVAKIDDINYKCFGRPSSQSNYQSGGGYGFASSNNGDSLQFPSS